MADLFGDVSAFHQKFGLEPTDQPDFPVEEIWKLKNRHMQEELDEEYEPTLEEIEEYARLVRERSAACHRSTASLPTSTRSRSHGTGSIRGPMPFRR